MLVLSFNLPMPNATRHSESTCGRFVQTCVTARDFQKNELLDIIDGPENRFSVVQKVFEKSR